MIWSRTVALLLIVSGAAGCTFSCDNAGVSVDAGSGSASEISSGVKPVGCRSRPTKFFGVFCKYEVLGQHLVMEVGAAARRQPS